MIKGNELRIGNLVFHGEDPKPMQYVPVFEYGKWFEFEQLNPIPLTEEWLPKFGFDGNKLKLFGATFIELDPDDGYNVFIEQVDEDGPGSTTHTILLSLACEHVHQLQNLYFALTGTELTLKAGS